MLFGLVFTKVTTKTWYAIKNVRDVWLFNLNFYWASETPMHILCKKFILSTRRDMTVYIYKL